MLRDIDWTCAPLVIMLQLCLTPCSGAAFNISLELQGDCSDQLTLICRHSDILTDPNWIHNGTVEDGQLLSTAFPSAMYTVQNSSEHRVTIIGVGNVRVLDGYSIQCVYSVQSNLFKSNAVKYSFIPSDYRPALSLVSNTNNFSKRLSTFTYSYQGSCSLYPRCTLYFSVEHTVSPQSAVSISSSGCSVEYTILNLMRCVSYQSTATTLISNKRGTPIVVGDPVMQSPSQFTITSVSIGACNDIIKVTYIENEPDCPGYPTERYTVDVDGVQVADLTADTVQSLAINHANGLVTLFLPLLNQPLPENAVTLNMTKYITVPSNRSDATGKIVTEMVTWEASAVFDIQQVTPQPASPSPISARVFIATTASLVALCVATVTVFGVVTAVLCSKIHKLKQKVSHQKNLSVTLPTLKIPYGDATPGDPNPSADPTPNHIHITSDDPSTIQLQPNPSYHLLEMGCQQQQ